MHERDTHTQTDKHDDIGFDRMHERDTHTQTDKHDDIGRRACTASRGKNYGSNGRPAQDSELLIM